MSPRDPFSPRKHIPSRAWDQRDPGLVSGGQYGPPCNLPTGRPARISSARAVFHAAQQGSRTPLDTLSSFSLKTSLESAAVPVEKPSRGASPRGGRSPRALTRHAIETAIRGLVLPVFFMPCGRNVTQPTRSGTRGISPPKAPAHIRGQHEFLPARSRGTAWRFTTGSLPAPSRRRRRRRSGKQEKDGWWEYWI